MFPPKHRKYWTYLLILLLLSMHCHSCLQFFHLLSCLFLLSNVVFRFFRLYIHHISSHVSVLPRFFNGFCWRFCIHPHFRIFSRLPFSGVQDLVNKRPFHSFELQPMDIAVLDFSFDRISKTTLVPWRRREGRGDVLGWFDAFFGELKELSPRKLCYFDGIWPAKIMGIYILNVWYISFDWLDIFLKDKTCDSDPRLFFWRIKKVT